MQCELVLYLFKAAAEGHPTLVLLQPSSYQDLPAGKGYFCLLSQPSERWRA